MIAKERRFAALVLFAVGVWVARACSSTSDVMIVAVCLALLVVLRRRAAFFVVAGMGLFLMGHAGVPDPAGAGRMHRASSFELLPSSGWSVIREDLGRRVDRVAGPSDGTAAIKAMVLGDRAAPSPVLLDAFRATGASHLLAVSGLHLAVIAVVCFGLARRLFWLLVGGQWYRVPVLLSCVVFTLGYTAVTGFRPSTCRAAFMVCLFTVAWARRRRLPAGRALWIAAWTFLLFEPLLLFNTGAALSFIAVFALVWVRPTGGRGAWARSRAVLQVTVVAWVATAPIVAGVFGALPGPSALINVVAVPVVELAVVPLGLCAVLTDWEPLLLLVTELADGVCQLVKAFAHWSPALLVEPSTTWWLAPSCGLLLLLARRRSWVAVAIGIILVWTFASSRPKGELTLSTLDVGQGDATIIQFPRDTTWLVDAGGTFAGPALYRGLSRRGVRRLARVIVTHAHPDHYAGLGVLVGRVPIRSLWLPCPLLRSRSLNELLVNAAFHGTRVACAPLGTLQVEAGASVDVLWPRWDQTYARRDPVLSENDNSLVIAVQFAGRRLLLTGDVEEEAEQELAPDIGPVDWVKAPHHGSKTSSSPPFVRALRPAWVVVSAGRHNQHGFPHEEVVQRWQRVGARVVSTQHNGTLTTHVSADGEIRVTR